MVSSVGNRFTGLYKHFGIPIELSKLESRYTG